MLVTDDLCWRPNVLMISLGYRWLHWVWCQEEFDRKHHILAYIMILAPTFFFITNIWKWSTTSKKLNHITKLNINITVTTEGFFYPAYLNSFCRSVIRKSFSWIYKWTILSKANIRTKQNAFFGFRIFFKSKVNMLLLMKMNPDS